MGGQMYCFQQSSVVLVVPIMEESSLLLSSNQNQQHHNSLGVVMRHPRRWRGEKIVEAFSILFHRLTRAS